MKNKTIYLMMVAVFCTSTLKTFATNEDTVCVQKKRTYCEERKLESEIEGFLNFKKGIKMDGIIDCHYDFENLSRYSLFSCTPFWGARYFTSIDLDFEKRQEKHAVYYGEVFVGWKNLFQIGAELGKIDGFIYASIGPQLVFYPEDLPAIKRIAVNYRVLPDGVLGFEYASHQIPLTKKISFASVVTARFLFPSKTHLPVKEEYFGQVSVWASHQKFSKLCFGFQYEYMKIHAELENSKPEGTFAVGMKLDLH